MNYSKGDEGDYFELESRRAKTKSNKELTYAINPESRSEVKGVIKKGA